MELNTRQLLELIQSDEKARKDFLGVFPLDKIPNRLKYPCSFIVNTDPSSKPGQHWLAFYFKKDRHCIFFDSYGNSPEFFKLKNFIFKHSTSFSFNSKILQSNISSLCGYYCCLFILFISRGFKLVDFTACFNDSSVLNDMTLFNILKQ